MTDLLLDFVSFFTTASLVQGDGIDIFRDIAPDSPDSATILYEYSGYTPMPQIMGVERPIQIVCRDLSATAAKTKARSLYNALITDDSVLNLTTDRWCTLSFKEPPFKLKEDEKERIYYGFNVRATTYSD